MCRKHGTPPPRFEERQGFLIVTFKAQMVAGGAARVGSQVESRVEWQPESQPESSTSPVPVQYQSLEERILIH
jgi:hypothetical protein